MADFIKREDAINAALEQLPVCFEMDAVESALMELPAADVRPVVRGRWIDEADADDLYVYHKCSVCGKAFSNAPLAVLHYCPNCGADMREVDDG